MNTDFSNMFMTQELSVFSYQLSVKTAFISECLAESFFYYHGSKQS